MTSQKANERKDHTVHFADEKAREVMSDILRDGDKKNALRNILQVPFGHIDNNGAPLHAITVNTTQAKKEALDRFVTMMVAHVNAGKGKTPKQVKDVARKAVAAVPLPGAEPANDVPQAPAAAPSAAPEKKPAPVTIKVKNSENSTNVEEIHAFQKVARAIFSNLPGKSTIPASYIERKLHVKFTLPTMTGKDKEEITQVTVSGGAKERVEQAVALVEHLLWEGHYMNGTGISERLLKKSNLDMLVSKVRAGQPLDAKAGTSLITAETFTAAAAKKENAPTVSSSVSSKADFNEAGGIDIGKGYFIPKPSQIPVAESIVSNALTIVEGPAGVGKTWTIAGMFLRLKASGRVKRLVLTSSNEGAGGTGEKLGHLPGTKEKKLEDKLAPYYSKIDRLTKHGTSERWLKEGIIQVAPLGSMRGNSYDSDTMLVFVEAQNGTKETTKMFLTRGEEGCIIVLDGDPEQNDLPKGKISGLTWYGDTLKDSPPGLVGIVTFKDEDIVRSRLTRHVIERTRLKEEQEKTETKGNQPVNNIRPFPAPGR